MTKFLFSFILLGSLQAFAATPKECLDGSFSACADLFEQYGRNTNKTGAVELFEKACSAQTLLVTCEIISSPKKETLKKSMELYQRNRKTRGFVVNGSNFDKIYQISEAK